MKRSILILFLLLLVSYSTFAVEIRLLGRAGVTYENGRIKFCPGFNFNTCAIVKISWAEVRDFLFSKEQGVLLSDKDTRANIRILDESGRVIDIISCEVDWIATDKLTESSPSTLNGNEIIFKSINNE